MPKFSNVIDSIAELWTGFNYFVVSITDATIAAAPISNVIFPSINVITRKQRGVSTREHNVPVGISYGELVLETPIQRLNSSLYSKINTVENYLSGRAQELEFSLLNSGITHDFSIVATNNTGFDGVALPITVYNVLGALAVSYQPSAVGYMDDQQIPVERVSFKVRSFTRELAADAAAGVAGGVSSLV